jgi:hypothetical protein
MAPENGPRKPMNPKKSEVFATMQVDFLRPEGSGLGV